MYASRVYRRHINTEVIHQFTTKIGCRQKNTNAMHSDNIRAQVNSGDCLGWRFSRALGERAMSGVGIRLHLDAAGFLLWGNRRLNPCSAAWCRRPFAGASEK